MQTLDTYLYRKVKVVTTLSQTCDKLHSLQCTSYDMVVTSVLFYFVVWQSTAILNQ